MGGGRPPYHSKMLTKVIVYAYTQRLYSSRQMAKAVRVQVSFMRLAARQTPDFRIINRFRGECLKILPEVSTPNPERRKLATEHDDGLRGGETAHIPRPHLFKDRQWLSGHPPGLPGP